jgi:MerR family transcriptional regulator, light-induced transcriptional regulator
MNQSLTIAILERDLCLSRYVLRKWESRYGFPMPDRDARGERRYPPDQIERLRLIKRLIDKGMRPSAAIRLAPAELRARTAGDRTCIDPFHESIFEMLRHHDFLGLRRQLSDLRDRQGLAAFILDTTAPLTEAVGEAWTLGLIAVHEEHLYSEVVQGLLRESIAAVFPADGGPRMILGTPPGESHGLGVLMLQGLMAWHGAHCLSLGTEIPMQEIAAAAIAQRAEVVGLSFSSAFPARRIGPLLLDLRRRLPVSTDIWAGGRGTARLSKTPHGTRHVPTLAQALEALDGTRGRIVAQGVA